MLLPLYGGRIGRCARGIAGACLIDVETLWFNSAVSIVVGKSRRRCFWIPSPGPMCDIWLKLVGAEINFDRRSVLNTHTKHHTNLSEQRTSTSRIQFGRGTYVLAGRLFVSRNENLRFGFIRPSRSPWVLISSPEIEFELIILSFLWHNTFIRLNWFKLSFTHLYAYLLNK